MEKTRNEKMNLEPRQREDYSDRQIAAAHRVLVYLGQVLNATLGVARNYRHSGGIE
jgi:hypothetical protein